MNKLLKKMTVSMLTALLIFCTLGASTFAWISIISNVKAKGMEFDVSVPNTIQIAKVDDNNQYTNTIDFSDPIVKTLMPTSSAEGYKFFAVNDLKFVKYNGEIIDDAKILAYDHSNPFETAGFNDYDKLNAKKPRVGYVDYTMYLKALATEGNSTIYVGGKMYYNGDEHASSLANMRYAILVEDGYKAVVKQTVLATDLELLGQGFVEGDEVVLMNDGSYVKYADVNKETISADNQAKLLSADNTTFAIGTEVMKNETTLGVFTGDGNAISNNAYTKASATAKAVIGVAADVTIDAQTNKLTVNETQKVYEVADYTIVQAGQVYVDASTKQLVKATETVYVEAKEVEVFYEDAIQAANVTSEGVVVSKVAGGTEPKVIKVTVRIWLDGCDANTYNEYFAKLTSRYALTLDFKMLVD